MQGPIGPPEPDHRQQQTRTFPCPGCGADLVFDPRQQSLKCPYCGREDPLEDAGQPGGLTENDLQQVLQQLAENKAVPGPAPADTFQVRCDGCGATVVFAGKLASTRCAYCGTPVQRADIQAAKTTIPVDGVLPFRIDQHNAFQAVRHWVRSCWFAPNDFLKMDVQDRLQGVYLPFWTFDALTITHYTGMRGEHYFVTVGSGKNRRTEMRTRWYPAAGSFRWFFDDVLVPAARGIPEARLHKLSPWPLQQCRPFRHEYLAGFVARTHEIPLTAGWSQARLQMETALERQVRARIGGDVQVIHSMHVGYHAITFKHVLLPVWLMAYRYRDRVYQVLVNAVTGEVQGERPWSWIKIAAAILVAAALAGAAVAAAHFAGAFS